MPGQQYYRKALLISRQRKVPGGNKTDHVDAWSLADALRVDGHGWKALAKEDPLVAESGYSAATRDNRDVFQRIL